MSVEIITGRMENCPHISKEAMREMWESTPPYLRDAKFNGIPVLGAGVIYDIAEEDMKVPDRPIPANWPRGFGMDVGWNCTAVGWFAKNPDTGIIYNYDYYYEGEKIPLLHAEAIKARGLWIPGAIDPRSDGRSQDDGKKLFETYTKLGLNLTKADNSITTGISEVYRLLKCGLIKVFESIKPFWDEVRIYRRKMDEDEKGKIVKKHDHYLDQFRYFCVSGIPLMKTADQNPVGDLTSILLGRRMNYRTSWMGS